MGRKEVCTAKFARAWYMEAWLDLRDAMRSGRAYGVYLRSLRESVDEAYGAWHAALRREYDGELRGIKLSAAIHEYLRTEIADMLNRPYQSVKDGE